MAILAENFTGIEIKSARDSLSRLEGQMNAYQRCFDSVVIVAHTKHIEKIINYTDPNIEIWEVSDRCSFSKIRDGVLSTFNNVADQIDLLNVDRLKMLLGFSKSLSVPRSSLAEQAKVRPLHDLRRAVLAAFAGSFQESSRSFWKASSRTKVKTAHIAMLSRYIHLRQADQLRLQAARDFWKEWSAEATATFSLPAAPSRSNPLQLTLAPTLTPEHADGY